MRRRTGDKIEKLPSPATRSRFLNSQALRLLLRPAAGPSGLGKKVTGSNPARTVHLWSTQEAAGMRPSMVVVDSTAAPHIRGRSIHRFCLALQQQLLQAKVTHRLCSS